MAIKTKKELDLMLAEAALGIESLKADKAALKKELEDHKKALKVANKTLSVDMNIMDGEEKADFLEIIAGLGAEIEHLRSVNHSAIRQVKEANAFNESLIVSKFTLERKIKVYQALLAFAGLSCTIFFWYIS